MLHAPLPGAWVTFQVTFTEFFIASTVFVSVAYKCGWRSAVAGSLLGAFGVVLVAGGLGVAALSIPFHVLDWVSALLLLGFGGYVFREFRQGLREARGGGPRNEEISKVGGSHIHAGLNLQGVTLAGWAVAAEGLEIAVVWLAVAIKQGMKTASVGVAVGLVSVGLVALLLGKSGIFRKVPAHWLDGFAAFMVTGYGLYFLVEALRG